MPTTSEPEANVHHDSTHQDDHAIEVAGQRFAVVPFWVADLGTKALVAYVALMRYANGRTGRCHPKVATLARDAGCCPNTIRDGIALLVEHGAVVVQERHGDDGSRLSNVYHLRTDPPAGREGSPLTTCTTPLQDVTSRTTPTGPKQTPNGVCESEAPRADVEEVVTALAAHVRTTTTREPTVTRAWRRDVRLMLDGPGKSPPEWTVEQLLFVIHWLDTPTRDAQFWSPNVLCPAKLRAQMPKLVAAIRRERATPAGGRDVESRIAAIRAGTRTEVSPLLVAAARAGRAAS